MSDTRHFGVASSRQLDRPSPPVFTPWSIRIRNAAILLVLSVGSAVLLYYLATAGAL